jgi:hypothetical protein
MMQGQRSVPGFRLSAFVNAFFVTFLQPITSLFDEIFNVAKKDICKVKTAAPPMTFLTNAPYSTAKHEILSRQSSGVLNPWIKPIRSPAFVKVDSRDESPGVYEYHRKWPSG